MRDKCAGFFFFWVMEETWWNLNWLKGKESPTNLVAKYAFHIITSTPQRQTFFLFLLIFYFGNIWSLLLFTTWSHFFSFLSSPIVCVFVSSHVIGCEVKPLALLIRKFVIRRQKKRRAVTVSSSFHGMAGIFTSFFVFFFYFIFCWKRKYSEDLIYCLPRYM